jgi:hypothetical protein
MLLEPDLPEMALQYMHDWKVMNLIQYALMTKKLIKKCKEEIEWAEANIAEMKSLNNYQDDDRVWLPCWLKAHKEMLDFITSASTGPETIPASDA